MNSPSWGSMVDLALVRRALLALDDLVILYPELAGAPHRERLTVFLREPTAVNKITVGGDSVGVAIRSSSDSVTTQLCRICGLDVHAASLGTIRAQRPAGEP